MPVELTSAQVWAELEKELFAVLGMVTAKGAARTVGIVYVAREGKLYIATVKDTWKTRHVQANPSVSITVPIAKRIPFLPMIKIPAATITFSGKGTVLDSAKVEKSVLNALLRGLEEDSDHMSKMRIIAIEPVGDFITYGVGIPLLKMRNPELARGRVPVI
jgi:hypothetical protein